MPHSDHSPSPLRDSFPDLPPFPDNVPTAPLVRISLSKLLQNDYEEQERCWKACCELGFFYLDLRTGNEVGASDRISGDTLLEYADRLFEVMNEFYDLDVQEKMKYDLKDQGSFYGYKRYGEGIIDKQGTPDRNELYNISKDDMLGLSPPFPSPAVLNSHRDLFKSYIQSSHKICMVITSLFSSRLALTPEARSLGGLPAIHRLDVHSGDQIRLVKSPPQDQALKGVALAEHTDMGSVTVLFNRVGGLQVRLPDDIPPTAPRCTSPQPSDAEKRLCEDGWAYVRPLPGHCLINLADALVKFSNYTLRSNTHRVVAPPGDQASVTRYSLAYFCRPEDDVLVRSFVQGAEQEHELLTVKEWIMKLARAGPLMRRRDDEGRKV